MRDVKGELYPPGILNIFKINKFQPVIFDKMNTNLARTL